jgi:hypothetical protein
MTKIELSNGKTVEMREMKVRDVRAVSKIEDDAEREFALVSNLTGLSPEELDDLPWSDYVKLQTALAEMGK